MVKEDTICAVSGGGIGAGISKIRMSGPDAIAIADKIFVSKSGQCRDLANVHSHTISYGLIKDSGEILDEVLISVMRTPKTYTREDVVEIDCHGGIVTARRVMELLLRAGARSAQPGEFTKRAFLNGRIDLSQAEAVMDIIEAETEENAKAAVGQLEGKLSRKIAAVRNDIVELLARIEVVFDYPEHDEEQITTELCKEKLNEIVNTLSEFAQNYESGRIVKDGIRVAITGSPNVGKSSLLNAIAGFDRAIVTEIPGTTRDTIEEHINVNGIKVILTDTAGIHDTEDKIEKLGIDRALKEVSNADIIILVTDISGSISEIKKDLSAGNHIGSEYGHRIIVFNKSDIVDDLVTKVENIRSENSILDELIIASAKDNIGIDKIFKKIDYIVRNKIAKIPLEDVFVVSMRHKELIVKAKEAATAALSACENKMTLDCICVDIKIAADHLGEVTGENTGEDVMNEIFSRFCLGK
jgi:tRNA modification GTPase